MKIVRPPDFSDLPKRRFDDKIFSKKNAWLWAWFDIPGGVWLTLFSGFMLILWGLAWKSSKDIPTGIVTTYSVVVTAYAASNISRWYRERIKSKSSESQQESD